MASNCDSISSMQAEDRNWLDIVNGLLKAGKYEQVCALLSKLQVASARAGYPLLSEFLSAARRICLSCSQYATEVTRHENAIREVKRQEQKLMQQVKKILNLVYGKRVFAVDTDQFVSLENFKAKSDEIKGGHKGFETHPSLGQRIQALLRLSSSPCFKDQTLASVEDVSTINLADKYNFDPRQTDRADRPRPTYSFVVYCLGPFQAFQNDQLIADWNGLKGVCILKYLISHYNRPVAKDILMDVFWPDADPEAARRNLHQAVYSLRQTLKGMQPDIQLIQFKNDSYCISPEVVIWIDFIEFKQRVKEGRHLEGAGQLPEAMAQYGIAEGLYQGDFLEEDLYIDWPGLQRDQLHNIYLESVDRLTQYYLKRGEYTTVVTLCKRVLTRDNCDETMHKRLMESYFAQGQRNLAVRQYQNCLRALKEELDLPPSEEIVELYQRIIAID